ncbi:MAG: AAA domain-containing protein [Bacteroidales bacterium]|nr:AAA domain-containing protein [Bacteroidales bacterium]
MITNRDIINYFDQEAEVARKDYEALMALPIEERIKKRKAIAGLRLDADFSKQAENGDHLYRLIVTQNLADFKEGEYLMLHKEGTFYGMQCCLYEFDDEDNIIISVYHANVDMDVLSSDKGLVLDKALVDLRQQVYSNFYYGLNSCSSYWENHIVNNSRVSNLEDISKNEEELDDTLSNYNLSITDKQRESIVNSMSAKDLYLIQGPPGTGKSFTLALIILEELLYFKHKVAVVGPNHMAINNALMQLVKLCPQYAPGVVKVGQPYNTFGIEPVADSDGAMHEIAKVDRINVNGVNGSDFAFLYGLTPHALYTSRARGLEYDTLVIDEAGQVTIPWALMAMKDGKKCIMAGDHKQLPPIITSDKISDDLKYSIFQKVMNKDNSTMLDVSFRMRKPICDFVSKLFYDGELTASVERTGDKVLCDDPILSFDTPIVFQHVDDRGMQTSDKEAQKIIEMLVDYKRHGLPLTDVCVLSPFRAQAANIRRQIKKSKDLADEDKKSVMVDTIDKMQGQEREVVILSMAAGDIDYMNEVGDFLYNPNKFNVAFSRAKSKLIIVGNATNLKKLDMTKYPHIKGMLENVDWVVE